ncbi:MAG: RecX family transcriptional regulator [Bacteroidetes bacterium]|nr:RecX family transcriptional regulator [Bacteroidota bacterium]
MQQGELASTYKKISRYCAYQERCHQEVRTKLLALGARGQALEEMMVQLISENFLNEERFAGEFANGKFRQKKWGRLKIRHALQAKEISDYCISKALAALDQAEYLETLQALIRKERNQLQELDYFIQNDRISKSLTAKGFEPELIWNLIKEDKN